MHDVCVCVYLINPFWCGEGKGSSHIGTGLATVDHEDAPRNQQHLTIKSEMTYATLIIIFKQLISFCL